MKSVLCFLLCLVLTFSTIPLGIAELISRSLPIDFSGGLAPQAAMFDGEFSYIDPTIQVKITYKETNEYISNPKNRIMGYWVADIKIGHASQLRTAAAESFNTSTSLPVNDIAERVNAVVAVNGDYFPRLKDGFAIRQGTLIRDKLRGQRDVLLIDEEGDFHVRHLPKKGELTDTIDGKKVINSFYFGPILVENGEAVNKLPEFQYLEPSKYYARLALCQVDHLHYKLILTTMLNGSTLGIRLPEFAKLCEKEGAKIAYNLDGGLSTSLYFNHKRLNEQNRVNFRTITDIVYFASTWNGEETK